MSDIAHAHPLLESLSDSHINIMAVVSLLSKRVWFDSINIRLKINMIYRIYGLARAYRHSRLRLSESGEYFGYEFNLSPDMSPIKLNFSVDVLRRIAEQEYEAKFLNVHDLISSPSFSRDETVSSQILYGSNTEPIIIINCGGVFHVADGNNRLAAHLASNEERISAYVLSDLHAMSALATTFQQHFYLVLILAQFAH